MTGVPDPNRANGSVGCYGKGQSILVNNIGKKPKLGEIKNKVAWKGKAAKKM